ncbi:histidine phosphatase family protein [Aspergillus melleus]|uniref:histidine phosphatase family protein n=1 Tax=Aspergillus melleus TaxID=138277 RepID=UPI001E8CD8F1|nr:uncharacterized protein LDX57_006234 [Aspergillus melleus]KAH8428538.1 hypothetical protein LDX57_006234 [Aspergillus melleus]
MMRGPVLYEDRLVRQSRRRAVVRKFFVVGSMAFAMLSLMLWIGYFWGVSGSSVVHQSTVSCNTVDHGNQCSPQISHLWGQYSPFFSLANESAFPADVPGECRLTFAQVLSRHGARYPTESKSEKYAQLIAAIQKNATAFTGKYAFLESYSYELGSDNLTTFGENQLVDSGVKFYRRYASLARRNVPFIRASGSDRVIASGEKFIEGFQQAKRRDSVHRGEGNQTAPVISVVIPETDGFNNTLDHGVCTAFEDSELSDEVEERFMAVFAPAIRRRLEARISGIKLSDDDVISLMDLCSFETMAATPDASELSPFCALFSHSEWVQFDYFRSLSKYYGYGAGNPLGPAQGIGFTNELIARLTKSRVRDHTSTNRTLDSSPATFPVDAALYADFSHDNLMVSAFFALGLYNGTKPLSQTEVQSIKETDGYSSAWLVPFGARAYIEAMQCSGESDSLVRVLVNDRVVPLHGCKTDRLGRCKLEDFVRGLSFARSGGNWDECFD